jgi:hypothetical protein
VLPVTRQQTIILLIVGLGISLTAGVLINHPGYMDAQYYFVTGEQLADRFGFQEPFIWNYLSNPDSIPHPSHGYWMPLTSIIAAIPMSLLGLTFRAAQLPFVLLSVLLPLLTAFFSYKINQDSSAAFFAGLLAAAPGFFLPFFLTTDMFILYAWIGTLLLWSLHLTSRKKATIPWLASGICVGLAHLARADGLLFVFPLLYFLAGERISLWKKGFLALAGYFLVMTPWFVRNLGIYGSVLPPGTQSALWLRSYEDLFRYPASDLSPGYLLEENLGKLLLVRFSALWTNLQRVLAENGLVFVLPIMILGIVDRWKLRIVRAGVLYWSVLILVMSFVFPFAGAQGGIFHSSAALMPMLWMLTPFGLRKGVAWVGERRGWDIPNATINFGWILIVLAAIFTSGIFLQRVLNLNQPGARWASDYQTFSTLNETLVELNPHPQVVMVNNPPGFYSVTGINSVVVPSGGLSALKSALSDFRVDYLILDRNHPSDLSELYMRQSTPEWLLFVEEVDVGGSGPVLIFQPHLEQDLP